MLALQLLPLFCLQDRLLCALCSMQPSPHLKVQSCGIVCKRMVQQGHACACAGRVNVQITYCCIMPYGATSSSQCNQSQIVWDTSDHQTMINPNTSANFGFQINLTYWQPGVYGYCNFNYTIDFQVHVHRTALVRLTTCRMPRPGPAATAHTLQPASCGMCSHLL